MKNQVVYQYENGTWLAKARIALVDIAHTKEEQRNAYASRSIFLGWGFLLKFRIRMKVRQLRRCEKVLTAEMHRANS